MIEAYYNSTDFTLYRGDSLQLLDKIETKADMVFADPPCLLSSGKRDTVSSTKGIDEFYLEWLSLACDRLKETGTIWICATCSNLFSVEKCLEGLDFKIINIIVWQKPDSPIMSSDRSFDVSAEYIIWATRKRCKDYTFNKEALMKMNGGAQMQDVWNIPAVGSWEGKCGKHPMQKPLRLLYRAILASTNEGDTILDPFAGSSTTGIAANLLGRKYIGCEINEEYLALSVRRRVQLDCPTSFFKMKRRMEESPMEVMVLLNYARPDLMEQMIKTGICYTRIGDSRGSILVTYGYERIQYVLLHTNGTDAHLYRLRSKGSFQIWTKETLMRYGFSPQSSPYYAVFLFDNTVEYPISKEAELQHILNSYRARIRPLIDFFDD